MIKQLIKQANKAIDRNRMCLFKIVFLFLLVFRFGFFLPFCFLIISSKTKISLNLPYFYFQQILMTKSNFEQKKQAFNVDNVKEGC